jgi:hypothetical protein
MCIWQSFVVFAKSILQYGNLFFSQKAQIIEKANQNWIFTLSSTIFFTNKAVSRKISSLLYRAGKNRQDI